MWQKILIEYCISCIVLKKNMNLVRFQLKFLSYRMSKKACFVKNKIKSLSCFFLGRNFSRSMKLLGQTQSKRFFFPGQNAFRSIKLLNRTWSKPNQLGSRRAKHTILWSSRSTQGLEIFVFEEWGIQVSSTCREWIHPAIVWWGRWVPSLPVWRRIGSLESRYPAPRCASGSRVTESEVLEHSYCWWIISVVLELSRTFMVYEYIIQRLLFKKNYFNYFSVVARTNSQWKVLSDEPKSFFFIKLP